MPTPQTDQLELRAHRAMAARDFAAAIPLWTEVLASQSVDAGVWLNLGACHRALGDGEAALQAVENALKRQPKSFRALMMKASLLERAGRSREAGPIYGDALLQISPGVELDDATARAVARAREVNRDYGEQLAAHLNGVIPPGFGQATAGGRRVEAFIELLQGKRKNYRQEPLGYFYPGLPAIEFWEREEFPWLAELEAARPAILEELLSVMEDQAVFSPYVDYSDGVPLDQWTALNRSRRWSAFHLSLHGRRVEENCARCPQTAAVLERLPQPIILNRSPAAMFSLLERRTHIPPHTGVANTRLVVHLPLIVPQGCRFRVGNEVRGYNDQAWVFDDTIEHEAWNDSDEDRLILLFDVWNPRIPSWEREMIARVCGAMDEFNGVQPQSPL